MNTIIINGSPKRNATNSNTRIVCKEIVRNMNQPCEIRCLANSDLEELADYVEQFDSILIVMPLYIHAMPGLVMKFIEQLKPASTEGKSIGFIIQAGFVETAQEKYVVRYLASLAKQLNFNYLGTVCKGEAAAIYMFPKMFQKVLKKFNDLGRIYEETHAFDEKIMEELRKPYQLSALQVRMFQFFCDIGLNNMGWHKFLKQNHAFEQRLDQPYL